MYKYADFLMNAELKVFRKRKIIIFGRGTNLFVAQVLLAHFIMEYRANDYSFAV